MAANFLKILINKWVIIPALSVLMVASISCQHAKIAENPYARTHVIDRVIGYQADLNWPLASEKLAWEAVPGLAVDTNDNVWVFTRTELPVQQYSSSGKLLRAWGKDIFEGPHGLRIDPDGNIWTTDTTLQIVRKFTPDGKLLMTLGTSGQKGCDKTHFDKPTDIAFSTNGDIFVADGYGNSRVVRFDKNGNYISEFGSFGAGPGQFDVVHNIVCDNQNHLYIADRNNCRIQVFDIYGNFIDSWENIIQAWGLCITSDNNIWACGTSPQRWTPETMAFGYRGTDPIDQLVIKFNTDGKVLQLTSIPMGEKNNIPPGKCLWVHALSFDSKGNLYLGDILGKRAQKFTRIQ